MFGYQRLSVRSRLFLGGALLGALLAWQFIIQPLFICPSCDEGCRQLKVDFQIVPGCTLCTGKGRVTYPKKHAYERLREESKSRGTWGP